MVDDILNIKWQGSTPKDWVQYLHKNKINIKLAPRHAGSIMF